MKPKLLLRIAALIQIFHAAGHTMGVATWKAIPGDIPASVIRNMMDERFTFMGKTDSTMAGFYSGFGYSATLLLLLLAALLWVLSARKDRSGVSVLWVAACALLSLGVVEIIYFFPMAVAFSLTSAALVILSVYLTNKNYGK